MYVKKLAEIIMIEGVLKGGKFVGLDELRMEEKFKNFSNSDFEKKFGKIIYEDMEDVLVERNEIAIKLMSEDKETVWFVADKDDYETIEDLVIVLLVDGEIEPDDLFDNVKLKGYEKSTDELVIVPKRLINKLVALARE